MNPETLANLATALNALDNARYSTYDNDEVQEAIISLMHGVADLINEAVVEISE